MLIQLPQKDIEAALKAHIAGQGINLTGKTVTMTFTASRKGNGISCELDISDVEIPGFDLPEPVKPVLAAVPSGPVKREAKAETPKDLAAAPVAKATIAPAVQEAVRAEAAAVVEAKTEPVKAETPSPFEADPAQPVVETVADATATVKPVTSLFG